MKFPQVLHLDGGVRMMEYVKRGELPDRHGKHHSDLHLMVFREFDFWYQRRIEIRRIILVQDLSLTHCNVESKEQEIEFAK